MANYTEVVMLPNNSHAGQQSGALGVDLDPVYAAIAAAASASASSYLISALLAVPLTADPQQTTQVTGYWTPGDQGGSTFVKTAVADAPGPIDNGIVFASADAAHYWVRRYSGAIDVRWFGAKGDGVADDAPAIQAAIDSCAVNNINSNIYIPPDKPFRCASGLHLNRSRLTLEGESGRSQLVFDFPGPAKQHGITIERTVAPAWDHGEITIRRIVIFSSSAFGNAAIYTNTQFTHLDDVIIETGPLAGPVFANYWDYGFFGDACLESHFNRLRIWDTGRIAALKLNGCCNATTFVSLDIVDHENSTPCGVLLDNAAFVNFYDACVQGWWTDYTFHAIHSNPVWLGGYFENLRFPGYVWPEGGDVVVDGDSASFVGVYGGQYVIGPTIAVHGGMIEGCWPYGDLTLGPGCQGFSVVDTKAWSVIYDHGKYNELVGNTGMIGQPLAARRMEDDVVLNGGFGPGAKVIDGANCSSAQVYISGDTAISFVNVYQYGQTDCVRRLLVDLLHTGHFLATWPANTNWGVAGSPPRGEQGMHDLVEVLCFGVNYYATWIGRFYSGIPGNQPANSLVAGNDLEMLGATARLVGGGGVFAAMAGETMDVQLDSSGGWTTVTFAAEATMGSAVTAIQVQLGLNNAIASGGQVDLLSTLRGANSRVQTQNVQAGITAKLGIPNNGNATVGNQGAIIASPNGTRYRLVVSDVGALTTEVA